MKWVVFAAIACVTVLLALTAYNRNISDKKAIKLAEAFYNKMGIVYTSQPFIERYSVRRLFLYGLNSKVVVVGESLKNSISTFVNCNDSRVIYFKNEKALFSAQEKHTVKVDNRYFLQWPAFITEERAKDIVLSLAKRIGIPNDFEFSVMHLDKDQGIWSGRWKRKYKGIEFESDSIVINIMAIDGELYGFTEWIKGEPCPTEAKVSKERAIEVASKTFSDSFDKDIWEKNKDKFEVKNCELKIVQTIPFWQRILSLNGRSNLAWIVTFSTKEGMERETVGILNKDKSYIKVDAATKKILSSDINVVP